MADASHCHSNQMVGTTNSREVDVTHFSAGLEMPVLRELSRERTALLPRCRYLLSRSAGTERAAAFRGRGAARRGPWVPGSLGPGALLLPGRPPWCTEGWVGEQVLSERALRQRGPEAPVSGEGHGEDRRPSCCHGHDGDELLG